MRRYLGSEKSIPLLFAALTVLGYGLLLGTAGFHWDDWGFAWAARFLGPAEFIPSFSGFRPFLGPIFFLTTNLVPPVPIFWQIFALLIRFCIGLATWWALKTIWPQRPQFALIVALFVLVFPGYSQHWVALTHVNQELIPFICYLLSFGLGARAVRKRSLPLTLLALFLQFWGLFPTEYFLGLEPLRLFFFWTMVEGGKPRVRLRHALVLWLPYLFLWLADGLWLAWLYRSEAYISYGIQTAQDLNLLKLGAALVDALLKAGAVVWGQVLFLGGSALPSPSALLTFALIAVTLFALFFHLYRLSFPAGEAPMAGLAILAGLAGILLGRLPSLAAGLPLTLQSVFDRFMISMALSAGLFMAGLIEILSGKRPRTKWFLVSLLVALAVGQQFYNANVFRRDWARQQEIYWQMAWRIPALEQNTLILTDKIPNMPLETDLSFTAPIDWIYAPEYAGGDLPYALLYTEARLGGGVLPELRPDMDVNLPFRTVSFHGSTGAALVILLPEPGCLRVLDPTLGDQESYEKESARLVEAIPFSDPSRILLDALSLQPPDPPFEPEPAHTWCFFYEKAELARQAGDWQRIIDLEGQTSTLGYGPADGMEWLPFVEAHGRIGDVERAIALSHQALEQTVRVRKGLCSAWERIRVAAPLRASTAVGMLEELKCLP